MDLNCLSIVRCITSGPYLITMTKLLKTLLIVGSLMITKQGYAQTNSDSLIFIRLVPGYKSNLVKFSSDLFMLKFKAIPNKFTYDDIFCDLSKGKFKSSHSINDNEIIDSLSKTFFIYKVEFEKNTTGQRADAVLNDLNHYQTGYLIPLEKDYGAVTIYIIQRFTHKFDYVQYTVTNSDCNEKMQCCVVKVMTFQ